MGKIVFTMGPTRGFSRGPTRGTGGRIVTQRPRGPVTRCSFEVVPVSDEWGSDGRLPFPRRGRDEG